MKLARRIVELRKRYLGGPALVKAMMKLLGVDCGPVRMPLEDVPKEKLAALKEEMKELGLPVV